MCGQRESNSETPTQETVAIRFRIKCTDSASLLSMERLERNGIILTVLSKATHMSEALLEGRMLYSCCKTLRVNAQDSPGPIISGKIKSDITALACLILKKFLV
ncbi:hypothetical protein M514_08495 [Trichuris suis]|uniref:Uncharacterized protein n=1 Tax=Trichuris suis TaxID=68888 RepID=A0A085M0E2_9BILA|nr:hypothetical protein M513_08495 [Trichuris suis]KFD61284.1 hypothetical protein M514_08495 [Trichuris suis]